MTHCNDAAAYEQYVLMERQLYRVFNLLTATSLRTRLVRVTYYDSERGREIATKIAFLIEDEERFAARSGLTPLELPTIDSARYDPAALALLDVFQYFVGNTDWSAFAGPAGEQCCHNVVPFARADGVLLPVPYDFDATGIVNSPYSLPDERLRIQTVRQRLYRGRCREMSELQPVFDRIHRAACGDQRAVHADRGTQRENRGQRARLRRRVLRLGGRCGQEPNARFE